MIDLSRRLEKAGPIPCDALPYADARAIGQALRSEMGMAHSWALLTAPEDNSKLAKNTGVTRRVNYSLSLAHADSSGPFNTCRHSTPDCRATCVADNGNGAFPLVGKARAWRTMWLAEHPESFLSCLSHEIGKAKAKRQIAMRPNNFSDLRWELICPDLFTGHPDVLFYDYTKWPDSERANLPPNYHLTRSWKQGTPLHPQGRNVAIVFPAPYALPDTFGGFKVIDGDRHDARYLDPDDVIVGLRAKGQARTGERDFVWN